MKAQTKIKTVVYLVFLALSLLSASAGNISINYGWNGSSYIPIKLTPDGAKSLELI